jgi:hypothetical protein
MKFGSRDFHKKLSKNFRFSLERRVALHEEVPAFLTRLVTPGVETALLKGR